MQQFAAALPGIRLLLDSDVEAAYPGDPVARSADEIVLCYPGILAIIHHRLAYKLYLLGVPLLARIGNPDYGLLANVADTQRISTLTGAPTPDDLDDLLTKVWKEPAFFLTHPLAIAAFGRECTRRGVPPPTVSLFGSQFVTWRGIPLILSDKVPVEQGRTKLLLLRVGDQRQGVVGLYQPGLPGEHSPGLSVRFMGMGIDRNAIASYLISLYCSQVVPVEDTLAVLDDVEVDKYPDYSDTYR